MFFQQWSGVNAVIFYTVSIFDAADSAIEKNLATVIVGITQFLATFGKKKSRSRSQNYYPMARPYIKITGFPFADRNGPEIYYLDYTALQYLTHLLLM